VKEKTHYMLTTTLALPVQGSPPTAVLLGRKLWGFGRGKYTGFGGKVEPGESVAVAAVRELAEEAGLYAVPGDLIPLGEMTFRFPAQPQWDQRVQLFLVERWQGEPTAGSEMEPVWFAVEALPYAAMWQDAPYWLPPLLRREPVIGTITFALDNETVDQVILSAALG
jgi:8-oxo-dGTP diphosphatase